MNCDQVFDILTRGPFPTGTSCDVPVEAHLAECADCRRLAEALRPAVELFQEAVDPEESRDLPGYWCAVATDRQSPALSYAREIEPASMLPLAEAGAVHDTPWNGPWAWRMAAVLAVGVTLGVLFGSGALEPMHFSRGGVAAALTPGDHDRPSGASRWQRIEAALVPAACYKLVPELGPHYSTSAGDLIEGAAMGHLNCCSGCHNAGSTTVTKASTARVAQSCQVCHVERLNARLSATP